MDTLRRWLTKSLPLLGGLGLLLGTAQSSQAQDPNAALLERLDRLEQQNEELKQKLELGSTTVNLEQGELSGKQVQKIVADYLKEVDKKKKTDDDAKKKKAAEEGVEVGKDTTFTAKFNNGLHFATSDGAFKAALRGRWQMDWGWNNVDDASLWNFGPPAVGFGEPLDDGALFRRARIGMQGTVWEVCDFVAEFDFAVGTVGTLSTTATSTTNFTLNGVGFREVWMGVRELPVIENFRAGHMKRVQGLEHLTSSRYLTFIERNICEDAFIEDYDPGLLISRDFADERITLAAGIYQFASDTAPINAVGDGNYTGVVRATALPLWQNNGRQMVFVGASYGYGHDELPDNVLNGEPSFRRFGSRPYRIDDVRMVDTGTLFYEDRQLITAEAAAVMGPLSIQGEYYWNKCNNAIDVNNVRTNATFNGDFDPSFQGFYVFGSYFLTGENRVFSRLPSAGPSSPSFTRQFVYEPFFLVRRGEKGCEGCCAGKGAWEIAARYGWLDLNDGNFVAGGASPNAIFGGELQQITLGVNWYWNSNMKVQFNYERLMVSDRGIAGTIAAPLAFDPTSPTRLIDTDLDTFVMRFAWDF